MAYVISDECVSCGTCESECPNEALSQGDDHYVMQMHVLSVELALMSVLQALSARNNFLRTIKWLSLYAAAIFHL